MPTARNPQVIATGHSLGGAIATLLAEHIICRLVTFGSPRVYFRLTPSPTLNHLRIVTDDDPVPGVPRILYSHRDEPWTLPDKDGSLLDVEDHSMGVYLARLLANCGQPELLDWPPIAD
jgi:hypothetical protein